LAALVVSIALVSPLVADNLVIPLAVSSLVALAPFLAGPLVGHILVAFDLSKLVAARILVHCRDESPRQPSLQRQLPRQHALIHVQTHYGHHHLGNSCR